MKRTLERSRNGIAWGGVMAAIFFASPSCARDNAPDDSDDALALRQIIATVEQAFSTGDRELMRSLYTDDGFYLKRSGDEYYGPDAVIDGLMPVGSTMEDELGPEAGAGPFKIVIDELDTGSKFGYIFGRVCSPKDTDENCHTRWFLVTEKGDDGAWRIQADLDLPHKTVTRSE